MLNVESETNKFEQKNSYCAKNKDRIKGCLLKQQGMYKNILLKPGK